MNTISAAHVLDEVSEVCSLRLRHLSLVNTSRRPFSLLAVASFINLRCLVISPHNLGDDLVECIGKEKINGNVGEMKPYFSQATCPSSATSRS